MSRTQQRIHEYEDLLSQEEIDIEKLQSLAHLGIPEKAGLRSIVWKILFNFLPTKRSLWPEVVKAQREVYREFLKDVILNTHEETGDGDKFVDPLGAVCEDDNDNAPKKNSKTWDDYFKDNTVLEQIDKDVKRLCPEFSFFQTSTDRPRPEGVQPLHRRVERGVLNSQTLIDSRNGVPQLRSKRGSVDSFESTASTSLSQELHWEVVERLLFVYAKLNPGIAYVQGMNEVMGPIYYIMATDPDPEWCANAEADTFFCFTSLMAEIRDNFIKTLDASAMGIGASLKKMMVILKNIDGEIAERLASQDLMPQYFALRWITVMLTQEFQLPDILRLWDSLFAAKDRVEYLLCICVGMICIVRDRLLAGEFADNLKLLQHYPEMDVHIILQRADRIRDQLEHERKHRAYLSSGKVR